MDDLDQFLKEEVDNILSSNQMSEAALNNLDKRLQQLATQGNRKLAPNSSQ